MGDAAQCSASSGGDEQKENNKMSDAPSAKELLATSPANSHLGSKTVSLSGEVDIGEMIEKSGCSDMYSSLEECLGENDRDWRKCQVEVMKESSIMGVSGARYLLFHFN